MKYRKKPVIVEAFQYDVELIGSDGKFYVPEWVKEAYIEGKILTRDNVSLGLVVQTLEGNMRADVGDYILKGVDGELYPCKKSVFEKTYEVVGE